MQRLEVSGAVRLIYRSLGVKGLTAKQKNCHFYVTFHNVSHLISNFRLARNVVRFLLGNSLASELYMPLGRRMTGSPSFPSAHVIFELNLFLYKNSIHTQTQPFFVPPAYEDGTDRVFRNVGT